jgi:hypothetical protein
MDAGEYTAGAEFMSGPLFILLAKRSSPTRATGNV